MDYQLSKAHTYGRRHFIFPWSWVFFAYLFASDQPSFLYTPLWRHRPLCFLPNADFGGAGFKLSTTSGPSRMLHHTAPSPCTGLSLLWEKCVITPFREDLLPGGTWDKIILEITSVKSGKGDVSGLPFVTTGTIPIHTITPSPLLSINLKGLSAKVHILPDFPSALLIFLQPSWFSFSSRYASEDSKN